MTDDLKKPTGSSRVYHSALRTKQAADTRNLIMAAARQLFAERGFAGATVAAIAQHAGVAAQTVYTVCTNKAEIMRELLSQLEADADCEGWKARIEAQSDPRRKLDDYAASQRTLFSTGHGILDATIQVGGEPVVMELRARVERNTEALLTPIIDALAEAGLLVSGLTRQDAIDRAQILGGLELYLRATQGRGWTDDKYQNWLTRVLGQQLLADVPRDPS